MWILLRMRTIEVKKKLILYFGIVSHCPHVLASSKWMLTYETLESGICLFIFKALSSLHVWPCCRLNWEPLLPQADSMLLAARIVEHRHKTALSLLPTATDGWISLRPATMDCRQVATLAAGNRKKIQMEQLPKENYYGHFGNFASTQKARLSSSGSGSGVVCYHGGAVMTRCRWSGKFRQASIERRSKCRKIFEKLRRPGRKYHKKNKAASFLHIQ